jgi:hypothetical protein
LSVGFALSARASALPASTASPPVNGNRSVLDPGDADFIETRRIDPVVAPGHLWREHEQDALVLL